ncbi:hypothetical protein ALC56_00864 [Trachymyrmex septentrionalis]|uniref:Uncharacterized protein n=1 Tax=Trachymyrmex septentrionalis TaxID=34720 RepID=A0A195FWQ4_9HYME|nr:hypothetical protein ALC56_00864 [Trachymyrmex septentrionalis]
MVWKSISLLGHAREERFTFEHLRFSVEFIIAYTWRNYYFIPPLRQLLRNGLHFELQITLRDC